MIGTEACSGDTGVLILLVGEDRGGMASIEGRESDGLEESAVLSTSFFGPHRLVRSRSFSVDGAEEPPEPNEGEEEVGVRALFLSSYSLSLHADLSSSGSEVFSSTGLAGSLREASSCLPLPLPPRLSPRELFWLLLLLLLPLVECSSLVLG